MIKKCSDVMTPEPRCCLTSDSTVKAAQLMKEENVGSIPVITENNNSKKLVGIITDRDIAIKVVARNQVPSEVRVEDVMSRDPIVCNQSDPANKAVEAMASHQVRRIPVVDHQNNLIGIISQGDIALRLHDAETTGEVVAEISE